MIRSNNLFEDFPSKRNSKVKITVLRISLGYAGENNKANVTGAEGKERVSM